MMSEISNLFKSLYSHFLLRDVAAKIIPGLINLFVIAALIAGDFKNLLHYLSKINPLALSVLLYGVGLMYGLLLQHMGYSFRIIRTHVWKEENGSMKFSSSRSIENEIRFLKVAHKNESLMRRRERFVVIKEISGNYAISLIICSLALLIYLIARSSVPSSEEVISLCVLTALAIFLVRQNWFHAKEQFIFESMVLFNRVIE
jgi:hypothetical protein